MIILEFKVKKKEISKQKLKHIQNAENEEILDSFNMPVRFLIEDLDFFHFDNETYSSSWVDIPLISLATVFLSDIKKLPKKKINQYDACLQSVFFEMKNNKKIRLMNMHDLREITVDYFEFLKALEELSEKIKNFINENVPSLKEHLYWGAWLRGEAEWDNDKGLIPIKKPKKQ